MPGLLPKAGALAAAAGLGLNPGGGVVNPLFGVGGANAHPVMGGVAPVVLIRAAGRRGVDPALIAAGAIVPMRPSDELTMEADAGDVRFLSAWVKDRKAMARWLAKEARDGSLVKKYKASAETSIYWPPIFKCHEQLNKVECVIALEMCCPEFFPLEF